MPKLLLHYHFNDGHFHPDCKRCKAERAAPELLDALKSLVNALNNGVIEVIRWNEGEQLIQNAESAIRKAEGE